MNKIITTFGLAALLSGFALSPAYAERDAQEREAYRDTQRQQGTLVSPLPTGPVIEGRNVYMAPSPNGAVEPYIRRAEENDRRSK
jgi:hypothetical protein